MNIIHTKSHSQLYEHKYVVIFRGIRYISNVANFELSEINNIFKCSMGVEQLKARVRPERGGTSKTCKSVQGEESPKIDEIERTYFLNDTYTILTTQKMASI